MVCHYNTGMMIDMLPLYLMSMLMNNGTIKFKCKPLIMSIRMLLMLAYSAAPQVGLVKIIING